MSLVTTKRIRQANHKVLHKYDTAEQTWGLTISLLPKESSLFFLLSFVYIADLTMTYMSKAWTSTCPLITCLSHLCPILWLPLLYIYHIYQPFLAFTLFRPLPKAPVLSCLPRTLFASLFPLGLCRCLSPASLVFCEYLCALSLNLSDFTQILTSKSSSHLFSTTQQWDFFYIVFNLVNLNPLKTKSTMAEPDCFSLTIDNSIG